MFANLFTMIITDVRTVFTTAEVAVASVWTFFAVMPATIVSIF